MTEEDLSAWSTVVTGRLVIDKLRVRGRSTSVAEVPEGARVGRDTAEVVVARDEARTALDALDAMPTRQASLLWAREVEGKSYEDLCEQFGMTEPAVRSTLTRARKALRREYELRGGTVPVGGLAVLAPWIAGLSWADKLRKCANKLTAPAVLGAAGIAALGGLVLSPFGSDHGATTFTPAQAVVASAVQVAGSTSSVPSAVATAPRAASPTHLFTGGGAAGYRPAAVTRTIHSVTSKIPCSQQTLKAKTLSSVHARGIGLGNAECEDSQPSSRITVHTPRQLGDYGSVSANASGVDCDRMKLVTQTNPVVSCSEAQQ